MKNKQIRCGQCKKLNPKRWKDCEHRWKRSDESYGHAKKHEHYLDKQKVKEAIEKAKEFDNFNHSPTVIQFLKEELGLD